jgi:hypothetical protein
MGPDVSERAEIKLVLMVTRCSRCDARAFSPRLSHKWNEHGSHGLSINTNLHIGLDAHNDRGSHGLVCTLCAGRSS